MRALGSVCSSLFSTTSPTSSSTPSSPDALSLLLNKVCVLQGILRVGRGGGYARQWVLFTL